MLVTTYHPFIVILWRCFSIGFTTLKALIQSWDDQNIDVSASDSKEVTAWHGRQSQHGRNDVVRDVSPSRTCAFTQRWSPCGVRMSHHSNIVNFNAAKNRSGTVNHDYVHGSLHGSILLGMTSMLKSSLLRFFMSHFGVICMGLLQVWRSVFNFGGQKYIIWTVHAYVWKLYCLPVPNNYYVTIS